MPLYLGKRNQKGVAVETTIEILSSDLPILEDPAALSEVLNGKEFLVQDGSKAIGTMPNNGATNLTIDGINKTSVNIPEGYTSGGIVSMTDDIENEVDTQSDLITQIATILENKAAGGGVDLPELTNPATNDKILSSYETIDGNGNKLTGTMVNNGSVSKQLDVSTTSYTIPEGYHNGSGKVTVSTETKTVSPTTSQQTVTPTSGKVLSGVTINAMPTATQATPSISVSSSGLITASATQSAGYVSAGTKSATKQLTTQAAKTITPTKSSQTAVAKDVYTTGAITVGAIPNNYITTTDATASADEIFKDETAYINGSKVTGTFTIDSELSSQDDLLTQLEAALEGKAGGGGSSNIKNTCVVKLTTYDIISTNYPLWFLYKTQNNRLSYGEFDTMGRNKYRYTTDCSSEIIENVPCGEIIALTYNAGYGYSILVDIDGLSYNENYDYVEHDSTHLTLLIPENASQVDITIYGD